MKLNIDLKYMEDYLPTPRHRKLRQRDASEPYSITVKETSSEKALRYWSNSMGELHHYGQYDITERELPEPLQRV